MNLKVITIGNTQIKNNLFLAPMAGYTDYCFRNLILSLGAGLTFSELVSAKGLVFGGEGSKELIYSGEDTKNTAIQLFGEDAYYLRSAIESKDLLPFDIIDINMGCPVPKVFKNGEGSALLTDILKAEKIIKECVKSGKNITVKIRTGIHYGDDVAKDYAVMAEQSGAKLITIHGRVRDAYYSGEVDYNAIKRAKQSVNIPVIANGGIFTKQDADKMIEETGADGVMIARGGLQNPFLFLELAKKTPPYSFKEFLFKHVEKAYSYYGDRCAVLLRKFAPYYFKNKPNSKELRIKMQGANTYKDLLEILKEV